MNNAPYQIVAHTTEGGGFFTIEKDNNSLRNTLTMEEMQFGSPEEAQKFIDRDIFGGR